MKVNRPLIEVFDKVCYLEHAKDWVPFCVASEMIAPSAESEHHHGIGRGMVGLFEFALGPVLRLKVRQDVTEFVWGKTLRFVTGAADGGQVQDLTSRLMTRLIPRTAIRFDFEPCASGTVLTVELSIWMLAFGASDVGRPAAAESLLQALARLKHSIEQSEPASLEPWMFFNYRRDDAGFAGDRIYDALTREFGEGAIVRDINHIGAGQNIEREVVALIRGAEVMLAVIGPEWMRMFGERRRKAVDGVRDWVAFELETALDSRAHVIPLLIGSTELPTGMDLPSNLQALFERNALRIRGGNDFERDIERLKIGLWQIHRHSRGKVAPEQTAHGQTLQ
ncbi:MAG TPA: toll/interleukin-1 receptor domain-containing protein [Polyangiaceae bacterium]|nr:toll/interleukin-1 receptor domain-containing protein [Polyangiaceae bacterium]